MNKFSTYNTLLASLQELYSKLAMMSAQIRIGSYHRVVQSNKNIDITNVLDKQVDDLIAKAVKVKSHPIEVLDIEHQHNLIHNSREKEEIEDDEEIENMSSTESEFAKYLKQRSTSSVSQPYMGEKLTASTWEHIHSAVRYARQGDADTAKLHSDIAGHALEEAGHYLNDKEYQELVFQIEHYFSDSQKV